MFFTMNIIRCAIVVKTPIVHRLKLTKNFPRVSGRNSVRVQDGSGFCGSHFLWSGGAGGAFR